MVVRKRKKVVKYRASTTHGGGHRKKRRGAGSRGGRGNAGSGKRAGQKKAGISRKLGSRGFSSHSRNRNMKVRKVNLSYFTREKLNSLTLEKLVVKEGENYSVELAKLGFDKLLGSGSIKVGVNFIAKKWSLKAEEKVKLAGGSITEQGQKKPDSIKELNMDNVNTDNVNKKEVKDEISE